MAVFAVAAQDDDFRHREPDTALHSGGKGFGKGALVISDNSMVWTSDTMNVRLLWPSIILHAVCRDPNVFPEDCLYLHTDAVIEGVSQARSEDSEDEGHDECPPVTELFFVPDNKLSLATMYNIMASCQALHPDPNDDFSPDEDFFDDDEENDFEHADQQMENMHISVNGTNGGHNDEEMFEDADENFPEQ